MPALDCPDEDTLLVLVRGQLPDARREAALAHVDACDECREVVARLLEPAAARARHIGRYRLVRPVGAGAMGIVYAAHDAELDRAVAIKILRHDHGDAARLERRLVGEARALARLAHPNVVAAFEVGRSDGEVFIAMELVQGETLAQWLAVPRTVRAIVGVFLQAGEGLAAAHAAGVVHRDIKPDNILVGRDGRVRVTDFGLAADDGLVDGAAILAEGSAPTRSATGALVGTPAYMAPELLAGGKATLASDQFAFAVALWEALYGARPFGGATRDALVAAMAGRPGVTARPVPAGLHAALARALRFAPTARWPSLRALLEAIARFARPARRLPYAVGAGAVAA
ncbi:MAG: protein kinase, partial [Deltaproteobacteria bacterium]|nr:protein kinase [Deltaproteobacteria bacterium]